jgi:hypothetical protein
MKNESILKVSIEEELTLDKLHPVTEQEQCKGEPSATPSTLHG